MRKLIVLACLSFFGLISCKTEYPFAAEGFIKAEVHAYDVDGCGFLLFLEDEKKLNPGELKQEFKKEGLKVWIRYEKKKGVMSTCMAGENIQLIDIRIRK
jgi:hypothetical protein